MGEPEHRPPARREHLQGCQRACIARQLVDDQRAAVVSEWSPNALDRGITAAAADALAAVIQHSIQQTCPHRPDPTALSGSRSGQIRSHGTSPGSVERPEVTHNPLVAGSIPAGPTHPRCRPDRRCLGGWPARRVLYL